MKEIEPAFLGSVCGELKGHEGFSRLIYKDTLGYPTIGYGFALHALSTNDLNSIRVGFPDSVFIAGPVKGNYKQPFADYCPQGFAEGEPWLTFCVDKLPGHRSYWDKRVFMKRTPEGLSNHTDEIYGEMGSTLMCSEDKADEILEKKVLVLYAELMTALPWLDDESVPDSVVSSLLNLGYNIGLPRLLEFEKTLGHLEAGDYVEAANEVLRSKWTAQVGKRSLQVARGFLKATAFKGMDGVDKEVYEQNDAELQETWEENSKPA